MTLPPRVPGRSSARPDEGAAWRVPVVALLLAVLVFVVDVRAPVSLSGGDSIWSLHQSYRLVTHGELNLDEYRPLIARSGSVSNWTEVGGHVLYTFPWGTAVVAAPFVAAGAVMAKIGGGNLGRTLSAHVPAPAAEKDVASAIAALTVGLLFLLLWRRCRSVPAAGVLAAAFAFGTAVMSTTSRALWMQGPALLLIVLVLHLLWEVDHPRTSGPGWLPRGPQVIAILGPLLVLAYAVRPTTLLLAVVAGAYVVVRHRRRLVWLIASAVPPLAGFFLVNHALWGTWQQPYYRQNRLGLTVTTLEAMAANLVSPARGLLVWTPVVVFAGVAVVLLLRRRQLSLLDGLLAGWVVVHLFVVSTLRPQWWAGWSVGPRFMSDVLPALFFLMCPALVLLPVVGSGDARRPLHLLAAVVFTASVGWGLFVNVRAANRFSVQVWNRTPVSVDLESRRVWDWHDPQFLR